MTKELQEAIEAIKKADWTEPMDYVGIPIKTLITAAQESIHLETVAAEMAYCLQETMGMIVNTGDSLHPRWIRTLTTYQTTIKGAK